MSTKSATGTGQPPGADGPQEPWERLYPDLAEIDRDAELFWQALRDVLPALLRGVTAKNRRPWHEIARGLGVDDRKRLTTITTRSAAVVKSLRAIDARLRSRRSLPSALVVEVGVRNVAALWDALSETFLVSAYFEGDDRLDPEKVAPVVTDGWRQEFRTYLRELAQRRIAAGDARWLRDDGADEWVPPPPSSDGSEPVGASPAWIAARRIARLSADRAAAWLDRPAESRPPPPLLLVGATGTGKELLAREAASVFMRSHPHARVVSVNCATIPDTLSTSILFGHLKGSFSGATRDHDGKFVEARGGVLFLDEIHRLPVTAQGGLLRVLETGVVEVLGQADPRQLPHAPVFVIAATNEDPDVESAGEHVTPSLADDLFHRLAATMVRLPTLRDRGPDEVRLLVAHFERAQGLAPGTAFDPDEYRLISDYEWPGNVRQLRRAVEFRGMLVRARGTACTLCGIRGHEHGAPVRRAHRAAAVEAVKRTSGGALTNVQVGAHLGDLSEDEVKKAWTDPAAKPGRKSRRSRSVRLACGACQAALTPDD